MWRLSETLLPRRRQEVFETPESPEEADSPAKAVKHVRFPDGLRTPPKILESHQFNQEEIDLAEENARLKEQPPSQACDLCKLFYLSHSFSSSNWVITSVTLGYQIQKLGLLDNLSFLCGSLFRFLEISLKAFKVI